jgi:hypothetical protein
MKNNLDESIEELKRKIKDLEDRNKKKKELKELMKKYKELTYPEKHPIRYKFSKIFKTLKKKSNELVKSAQEYNRKNSWDLNKID